MKFRGRITDLQCMRDFSNIINTLSKIGKYAVVFLTPATVSFVVFDEGAPRRPLAQCFFDQRQFFTDYDVFGISEEFNQICLQFCPDLLATATSILKSNQTPRSFKIKLTKKTTPCLTCEIETSTQLKHSRVCTHDVPVKIVSQKNWPDYQLPDMPDYDISIVMPLLKKFKSVCDRMKLLSSQLILEASPNGILALKTETDLATVSTFFTNLKVKKSPDDCSPDHQFEVKIDFKKIIGFLTIDQTNPNSVVCNIANKKFVFMTVSHDNFTLNCLILGLLR